jgi:HAD superfamily hydrolase (TIGR01458 family)
MSAMTALDLRRIRLFLFDVDGVFLAGKTAPRLLSGRRVIASLAERRAHFRLVTNTSTHRRAYLARTLQGLGVNVTAEHIHSALETTVAATARRFGGGRCYVVGEAGMRQLAAEAGLRLVDEAPADVVLVGLARHADYQLLSAAARCLKQGAALIGCHRNRLWLDEQGYALSCGAWLAALQYATGVTAETYGKPARQFFDEARAELGVAAEQTLMVGDDPVADVRGAQQAGLFAALVLSGKTSRSELGNLAAQPDLVLDEVDDLVELL